ncbi:hypothetical protein WMZ97_17240 [Lentibacillus sp. N15]|uniref:hypothetical protein n=1 Tax=Lentibacillus songyuanensis TaxID=3136161 RepID=UPI0031BA0FBB
MGYEGYSIVGDLSENDAWKKKMETYAQKEQLKSRIKQSVEESNLYLSTYLEHANATGSMTNDHLQIQTSVNALFDGKAKRALSERFSDNLIKLRNANMEFDLFKNSIT